jgi:hypothetical protein
VCNILLPRLHFEANQFNFIGRSINLVFDEKVDENESFQFAATAIVAIVAVAAIFVPEELVQLSEKKPISC